MVKIKSVTSVKLLFLIAFTFYFIPVGYTQTYTDKIDLTTDWTVDTTLTETEPTTSSIIADSEIIKSPGYPDSYLPDSSFTITRLVEDGYQIDVLVEELDLDPLQGDYLLIRSGEIEDDSETVLHGKLKSPKTYRTSSNYVYISFVVQSRSTVDPIPYHGFQLKISKAGVKTTTPLPTTTDVSIPVEYREFITVYLTGVSPEEFLKNKVSQFIDVLVEMSTKFCQANNIKAEITHKNIDLKYVTFCPVTWPNYRDCIQIIFAIPISLTNNQIEKNSASTYQLNKHQLTEMWDDYHEQMIADIGMREFDVPNFSQNLWIWLGFFIFLIAGFCGLLFVLWKYDYFSMRPLSIRRLSDSHAMEDDFDKPRFSDTSLYPSQHQLVPPLFDTPGHQPLTFVDDEFLNKHTSFQLYEPDFLATVNQQDLLFDSPPSYATKQDFGVGANMGFVNDEENIIFDRQINARRLKRNVSFDDAINDSKL